MFLLYAIRKIARLSAALARLEIAALVVLVVSRVLQGAYKQLGLTSWPRAFFDYLQGVSFASGKLHSISMI